MQFAFFEMQSLKRILHYCDGVAQLIEHRIATPRVIGLNPVTVSIFLYQLCYKIYSKKDMFCAGVMELVDVSGLEPEFCRFKSCHPYHFLLGFCADSY